MSKIFANYIDYWKSIFNYQGKATRAYFWSVFLGNFIIGICIGVIAGVFSTEFGFGHKAILVGSSLNTLLFVLPQLSLTARRIRDMSINNNLLIAFIILICICCYVIQLVMPFVSLKNLNFITSIFYIVFYVVLGILPSKVFE